nr:ribonuclease H-like domain-containing protein [Tanacetum cinerariifolium]
TCPSYHTSIFLGYPYNHRGYRSLDLNSNKIIISRHVTFDETVFPFGSMTPTKPPSYQFLDDNLDTSPIALRLLTTPTSPQQTPPQTTPQTTLQATTQTTPPTPSLYGLKQSPRAWFQRFSSYAIRVGFYHSKTDSSFFIFHKGSDTAYLLLFVDDIILTASSTSLLQRIISSLHAEFAMTDLGPLNYFLGISAMRTTSGIFLSQKKYATEILEQAHILNCNPCKTSIDTEKKLRLEGSPLIAYSDADWAGCPATRRSTSGYCVFLSDNLLTWSFKRQDTLSRFSAEAEYRGVTNAVAKTSWICNLLRELHTPLSTATLVYCDNVSAVYMSANPVQHQRTKHIQIDIHFVRDKVAAGHVRVLHVPSRFQCADIFTKGLPYPLFADFRSSLSVRKSPAPTTRAY